MDNQIDELLSEIEKFKTNVSNSNKLMEILQATMNKIEAVEKKIVSEHDLIINKVEVSLSDINKKNTSRSIINYSLFGISLLFSLINIILLIILLTK